MCWGAGITVAGAGASAGAAAGEEMLEESEAVSAAELNEASLALLDSRLVDICGRVGGTVGGISPDSDFV